jgi:hypothetical protein
LGSFEDCRWLFFGVSLPHSGGDSLAAHACEELFVLIYHIVPVIMTLNTLLRAVPESLDQRSVT